MSTRAVTVPAESILAFLRERGFTERTQRGAEIVYERAHKEDRRYRVIVYTSVRKGAASARGVGKDAIRVCAIYDDGTTTRGLGKWPRVHRTGSVGAVLERMLERMRLAYERCSEARPKPRARVVVEPGAPQPSDLNFIPRVFGKYGNGASGIDTTPRVHVVSQHVGDEQIAEAFTAIGARMDAVQQKHHPGSMSHGHERSFGESFPEDDLDGDEPT